MIVLDASVLIAYFDNTDAHHSASEALLTDSIDDDLAASTITLAEVLVAPARDGRIDEVRAALRDLEVQELRFPANCADTLALIRVETRLKMPDCCVILAAESAHARIASFDDRLVKAAEARGLSTAGRS